jgi:hypothetical protein
MGDQSRTRRLGKSNTCGLFKEVKLNRRRPMASAGQDTWAARWLIALHRAANSPIT